MLIRLWYDIPCHVSGVFASLFISRILSLLPYSSQLSAVPTVLFNHRMPSLLGFLLWNWLFTTCCNPERPFLINLRRLCVLTFWKTWLRQHCTINVTWHRNYFSNGNNRRSLLYQRLAGICTQQMNVSVRCHHSSETHWYGSLRRCCDRRKAQRETVAGTLWSHTPGIWASSGPLC